MTLPTMGVTGQRQPESVQYKVAACATAPVAPSTDFTTIGSNINQREFSGKQNGAFAISKNTSSGNLTLMMATGENREDTWIPITRSATLTPAAVAALSFTTDLTATKSVAVAAALTLTVVVAGGYAPYTYTWYKDGAVVGTNSTTFTKASAAAGDAGKYKVVVTDLSGTVITSTECTVTVA